MNHLVCKRCGGNPGNGVSMNLSGPATGHHQESLVLCANCTMLFRSFLIVDHVRASDEVTPARTAHIESCRECQEKMGWRWRPEEPRVINKQRVAERFARKGLAQ